MIIMCVLRLFVIEEDNQRLENLLRLGLMASIGLFSLGLVLSSNLPGLGVMDMAKG